MSAKAATPPEAPPAPTSGSELLGTTFFPGDRRLSPPRRKLPSGSDLLATTQFPGLCRAEEPRRR